MLNGAIGLKFDAVEKYYSPYFSSMAFDRNSFFQLIEN